MVAESLGIRPGSAQFRALYIQNVEAIRILFQKVVQSQWAGDFPWEKWQEPHLNFPDRITLYADEDEPWRPVIDRDQFKDSLTGHGWRAMYEKHFDKLRKEIRNKHYSIRTERSYEEWVARFLTFHACKDPLLLSANHVTREGVPVAAIKWALQNESVDAAIVCMTNHEQLDQNLRAMAEPFTEKDDDLLKEQLAAIGPTYCRMCGSCGGVCDKGVPVPDVLRFLTYAEGYAQFTMAREHFQALPDRVRAVRCDRCPTCSVRCPNGVRVRERLTLAQEMFA